MEILRKSLKAYIIAILLFAVLTLALAAVISFTPFKEEWAFAGLIGVLFISSVVLGIFEGKITGKRGLVTGILSSAILIVIVLFSVSGVFESSFGIGKVNLFYLIPLAGGAIGGIAGVSGANG